MDPVQQPKPAEPEAFSQFPAPPNFYHLYEAGPDAGPPPPLPIKGQIHALGEFFDTVSVVQRWFFCVVEQGCCVQLCQEWVHWWTA